MRTPSSLGDLWTALPRSVTDTMLSTGRSRASEIFAGVAGALPGPWAPVRPLLLRRHAVEELAQALRRIAWLALDACRRRAATAGELLEVLGHSRSEYLFFDPAEPVGTSWLASSRIDVVLAGGTFRVIGLNIDSALAGALQTDQLTGRFFHRYGEAGLQRALGLRPGGSALTARAESIRRALGGAAGVAFPFFTGDDLPAHKQPDAFRAFLERFAAGAREVGLDARTCALDELREGSDGRLRMPDGWVADGVFRLFAAEEVRHHRSADDLARAAAAGKTHVYTGEAARMLRDPRVLGWLCSDVGLLSDRDASLIRRHVADPAGSGGGAPELVPMEFVHTVSGARVAADVSVVVGAFLFDLGGLDLTGSDSHTSDLRSDAVRPPAVMVRHGGPDGESVLNCALLCDPRNEPSDQQRAE
ncbi:hypothetical protein ACIPSA_34760 [Streptomyces sp. NPDC086549]|uniref:hypothetical protein n=1 Tax=Streptomyces sp. NPDC086549 TaxID=3365752 RepID=UPI0038300073